MWRRRVRRVDLEEQSIPYPHNTAKSLILVAGVSKIVPTLEVAMQRIREYAYPLDVAWSKKVNCVAGQIGKCVILSNERQQGRVTLILVNDVLGY